MADFADINMEILSEKIDIDLVRVAFHRNDLVEALETCIKIKLGYNVSINAMAIINYNKEDLDYLFNKINTFNLDILIHC